uniref:Uncharacterized protein n=1 Tax=Noctiluca scintillans TaxID=2966 RepID=A0A7S0ZU50_NOCSC
MAVANLLDRSPDNVELIVPVLSSSSEPFNVTVRYFDDQDPSADLANLMVCAFTSCTDGTTTLTVEHESDSTVYSFTDSGENSTAFATELAIVLSVHGQEVPSGLEGSSTFLPSYVAVYSEKLMEYEFIGCTDAPQIANVGNVSTCEQTTVDSSCTVECADGYEWPLDAGPTCLTSDGFWEVLAECVPSGSSSDIDRVVEIVLLVTPGSSFDSSTSVFSSQWAYENTDILEIVFAGLLDLDSDDVEASVPSTVASSSDPFNITFRVIDEVTPSNDLAENIACALATCTDEEVSVTEETTGTTQLYIISASLVDESTSVLIGSLQSYLEANDEVVPTGLASATVALPTYVAVMDEFVLVTWNVGEWGSCSNYCGNGSQTRNVTCSLGADSACSSSSSKPEVSQSCTESTGCIGAVDDSLSNITVAVIVLAVLFVVVLLAMLLLLWYLCASGPPAPRESFAEC